MIDFDAASNGNNDLFKSYFHDMLNNGVYFPPSAFESYFLNDALSEEGIAFTLGAFQNYLNKVQVFFLGFNFI
ncbi:MAG: hypothetical protein C7M88_05675, partial [Candidatus Arcticimaribacter sp.]